MSKQILSQKQTNNKTRCNHCGKAMEADNRGFPVYYYCPDCDKQATATGETRFRFNGWDNVETRLAGLINCRRFEITGWRFADSAYWHKELCEVPAGAAIVVKWGEVEPEPSALAELIALEPRLIALERKTAELYELSQAIFNGGGGSQPHL